MEEEKLDRYFKEQLAEHSIAPSEGLWDRIDQELGTADDSKGGALIWRQVALLSLAALLAISGLFWWRMDRLDGERAALQAQLEARDTRGGEEVRGLNDSEAEQTTKQVGVTGESSDETEAPGTEQPQRGEENGLQTWGNQGSTRLHDTQSTAIGSVTRTMHSDPQKASNNAVTARSINERPSQDSEASIQAESGRQQSSAHLGTNTLVVDGTDNKPHSALSTSSGELTMSISEDRQGAAPRYALDRLPPMGPGTMAGISHERGPSAGLTSPLLASTPHPKWSIGLSGLLHQNYRRIALKDAEDRPILNALDRAESPAQSYGLSGHVTRALGKRLSISLGLEYSSWRQDGNYRVEYSLVEDSNLTTLAGAVIDYQTDYLTSLGYNDVVMQGEISSFENLDLMSTGQSELLRIESQERITWLSIPLSFRYQTYLGRWGLQAQAGLGYEHIMSESTTLEISGELVDTEINRSGSSSNGMISGHAGLGLFYRLSDRVMIHTGPRYKSWLIPLYEDDVLRSFPYSRSMEAGIQVDL